MSFHILCLLPPPPPLGPPGVPLLPQPLLPSNSLQTQIIFPASFDLCSERGSTLSSGSNSDQEELVNEIHFVALERERGSSFGSARLFLFLVSRDVAVSVNNR